ncbi:10891_t:CDS:2, partial [Racocetra fulgida]
RRSPTTDPKAWPLTIRCRDFNIYTFSVEMQEDAIDVFNTIQRLTCSIKQVYAFEHILEEKLSSSGGWSVYDVLQEYDRMGIDSSWRFSIDEKLIEAIFRSNVKTLSERVTQTNLIIDARPTANAMVNVAMGAGTENVENYKNCERRFMGIDNIHVMRESLGKMVE